MAGEAALAQDTGAQATAAQEAAREHFRRGESAYQKGSYALAISEWQAAYASDPRPRIQYNIYQAYERLGQLQEASAALQRYLSTADPDDPYYSDATARMAALQQRLQATGIRLTGGVDGATINVSGHDWGRLPRPDRIPVQPGNHRVLISLPGYEDFVANVVVPPGQVVDVAIQLEPSAEQAPQAAPAMDQPPNSNRGAARVAVDRDTGSSKTPLFIAAGALGAGALGAGIWAIERSSELDGCDEATFFCAEEDAVSTQRTVAIVATAALGAGAIGLLIYALTRDDDENATAARCVPSGSGASCTLRF